ncbi:MAG: RecX family transcriptional regulator [Turicibacter sp.]|nr:RecX family transcriptional regulator [Turicibacter sp.]
MKEVYTVLKLAHKKQQLYEVDFKFPNGETYVEQVHEELVLKFRLVAGKELTEEQMAEFMSKRAYGEVYQAGLRLASAKLYPMAVLDKKLLAKDFDAGLVDEVLFKLSSIGLINDEKYAMSYISHHISMGKKGPSLLKRELMGKGIAAKVIDKHLVNYGEDDAMASALKMAKALVTKNKKYGAHYLKQKISQTLQLKGFPSAIAREAAIAALGELDQEDEEGILFAQAEKLYKKYSHLPDYEGKQKLIQALGRKGFSYDVAKKAYQQLKEQEL